MIEFELFLEELQQNAGLANTYEDKEIEVLVSPMMMYLKR